MGGQVMRSDAPMMVPKASPYKESGDTFPCGEMNPARVKRKVSSLKDTDLLS